MIPDNRNNNRPIKVLHITDQLSKGGAGRALIGVAKYSGQMGNFQHECISLQPTFDGVIAEGVAEGLKVHIAPEADNFLKLYKNADIIQWHWWQDFPLMHTNLPRKPTIVWCAVSGEYPPNELTREVVDFADAMVITNPMTRDLEAIRSLPETERQRKVKLIFESADFDRILPVKRFPHDTFNIGWIGTICPGKYNTRYVEMSRKIDIPNVRFQVCGDGPLREAAIEETVRLGVQDRFDFLGYCDDMRRIFGQFDVYGFPLDEKTFAGGELNLQEAMVAALPIVIFPYGGPKRMILHNYNGLVVYSEREYKEAIEYLYHHLEERERLGNNAKEYALREFGAENAARKFNQLYSEMLSNENETIRIPGMKDSLNRLADYHRKRGNLEKAFEYERKVTGVESEDRSKANDQGTLQPVALTDDIEKIIDTRSRPEYKVTAIVSTYASEDLFEGCLSDLYDQTLYRKGELEIVVIDAASPQDEWSIVERFASANEHVLAVRTKQRESLYAAWNRAIKLARGKYLTNANTDDRHRRDALEILAKVLDEQMHVALAYGDVLITTKQGETFENNTAQRSFEWGEYSRKMLEQRCCMGPQPMWKHSIHDELGYFDERYVSAGDYDFWLRISLRYPMYHVDEKLGLYLDSPESLEHKGFTGEYERIDVLNSHHLRKMPALTGKPLVSVIIPTYERKQLLNQALESLIDQTYDNWEALVINDGGEPLQLGDGIPDDERIKLTNLSENHERSYCRNSGIRSAKGQYIAFLDDDDIFYRHHLELAVRTLESPGERRKVFYSASHQSISKMENGELVVEELKRVYGEKFDRQRFLVNNYIPIHALVFNREVFSEDMLFDEEMNCLEDFDLLIRLTRKYDFRFLNLITHEFRTFPVDERKQIEAHKENYQKLYHRYRDIVGDDWEVSWKQQNWIRTLDMQLFRMSMNLPVCTVIILGNHGHDELVMTVNELSKYTDYPKVNLIFSVPEDDHASLQLLDQTNWKDNIIPVSSTLKYASVLWNAAKEAGSPLLLFLDSRCVPCKNNWLSELIDLHNRENAGLTAGLIVEPSTKAIIRNASFALNRQNKKICGLYPRFPFYHPVISRIGNVDAVGAGMVLVGRDDFLKAGGLDPTLSKMASWIDLSVRMKDNLQRNVFLNPNSFGTYLHPDAVPVNKIPDEDQDELKGRWGEDFLKNEEWWFVKDGFCRDDSPGNGTEPDYGEAYDSMITRADKLKSQNRMEESLMILRAAKRVYPDDRSLIAKIEEISGAVIG
ncbi:hypothetical protein CEE37_07375 [candidate division LCP-89 bacterium B3_LCP]|uniref:Glycosyltransferase 2-like domain-containing protein n=1 Tax=candidate division LCP-89 bacterium B3_LCP TaxID=2012998 RepID=A0A532V0T1_UNCL8|nr:MAG: hypothetical protein CEE37_07375 [candidate division LCP-89 bacterium B3_LCP]